MNFRILPAASGKFLAYQLGSLQSQVVEHQLIRTNKLIRLPEEHQYEYQLLCQSGHVRFANAGDYFTLTKSGFPVLYTKELFEHNCQHISGNCYEHLPHPLEAWQFEEHPQNDAVQFLINSGKLTINPNDSDKFFQAHRWGTDISMKRDATVIIYHIFRDHTTNAITDVSFSLISSEQFSKNYTIMEKE